MHFYGVRFMKTMTDFDPIRTVYDHLSGRQPVALMVSFLFAYWLTKNCFALIDVVYLCGSGCLNYVISGSSTYHIQWWLVKSFVVLPVMQPTSSVTCQILIEDHFLMYLPGMELMAKSILAIPAGICTFIISDRSSYLYPFGPWWSLIEAC